MANGLIAWDIEEISARTHSLLEEKNNLEEQRNFLENINSIVETAWQGIAGKAYDSLMDIDIDNFNTIIKSLESLADDLNYITDKCYNTCEDEISVKLKKLAEKVS